MKNRRGLVLLEAALVVATLAVVGVFSAQLFYNLNQNMVDRMKLYRASRIGSMNSLSAPARGVGNMAHTSPSDPVTYLDYAPHMSFTYLNGEDSVQTYVPDILPPFTFDPSFGDDPRFAEVNAKFEDAHDIADHKIPDAVDEVYSILGGDTYSSHGHTYDHRDIERNAAGKVTGFMYYWRLQDGSSISDPRRPNPLYDQYIGAEVNRAAAVRAKALIDEMVKKYNNYNLYNNTANATDAQQVHSLYRAMDDIFEDSNGVDTDRDGWVGGLGVLQQILDTPLHNGPYDMNFTRPDYMDDAEYQATITGHRENREQLQGLIDSVESSYTEQQKFIDEQVLPRLVHAQQQLSSALTTYSSNATWNAHYDIYSWQHNGEAYTIDWDGPDQIWNRWWVTGWRGHPWVYNVEWVRGDLRLIKEFYNRNLNSATASHMSQLVTRALGYLPAPADSISLANARNALGLLPDMLDEPEVVSTSEVINPNGSTWNYNRYTYDTGSGTVQIRDQALYTKLQTIQSDLQQAVNNWSDTARRVALLQDARTKLGEINDAYNRR